jgi:hypothetical protein
MVMFQVVLGQALPLTTVLYFASAAIGDFVNIISPEMKNERLAVSALATTDVLEIELSQQPSENSLIAHPDILFPMTSLANGVDCLRRPLVMELVKKNGVYVSVPFSSERPETDTTLVTSLSFFQRSTANRNVLLGNIQHELLQAMLKSGKFSAQDFDRYLDGLLKTPRYQLDMWSCQLSVAEVRAEVQHRAQRNLVEFGSKWIGSTPKVALSKTSLKFADVAYPSDRYMQGCRTPGPNWLSRACFKSRNPS